MFFYVFKMAVAIAFLCENAVEAIQISFISMILNLNGFYSIFAKKCNSHGHFKYIKKHKIIPRNCCFCVITLCSSKTFLLISMIWKLNCFYSIFSHSNPDQIRTYV